MTACPFFYCLFILSTPTESTTNGSGKAETQNALKIAPKTGFFYCLDRLHEKRRNAPKNRKRNAKNGKHTKTDGATNTQHAKTRTETGQKRTKAGRTDKHTATGQTREKTPKETPKRANGTQGDKRKAEAGRKQSTNDKPSRATSHRATPSH